MGPNTKNSRKVIGVIHDWVAQKANTPYVPTPLVIDTTKMTRDMPVNQSNKFNFKTHKWESGGEWFKRDVSVVRWGRERTKTWRPQWGLAYDGFYYFGDTDDSLNFSALPHGGSFSAIRADLELVGAEAYNLLRPDLPDFSLATEIAELKDVFTLREQVREIRTHLKNRTSNGRSAKSNAGRYYLAIQFGYLPLVRSAIGLIKSARRVSKLVDQLIRDEGKPVRRQRHLSQYDIDTVSDVSTVTPNAYPPNYIFPKHVTQCYVQGNVQRFVRTRVTSRTWASARFRYILPKGPNGLGRDRYRLIARLLGGDLLTPDSLYQIMPWSWLIDYFVNLGDFVKSLTNGVVDRLYTDYFFLMREYTVDVNEEVSFLIRNNFTGTAKRVYCSRRTTTRYKIRIKGSPFGFGLTNESLNPHQQAILGALGLSKLP